MENKGKWIGGASDIEADWEEYKNRLNKMGLERFMEIYTSGYERSK